MSAGQTTSFFSNIKIWEFPTLFYCVADVANCKVLRQTHQLNNFEIFIGR